MSKFREQKCNRSFVGFVIKASPFVHTITIGCVVCDLAVNAFYSDVVRCFELHMNVGNLVPVKLAFFHYNMHGILYILWRLGIKQRIVDIEFPTEVVGSGKS